MGGPKLIQLSIIGLFPTAEYQKCKYYAEYLNKQLPYIFDIPKCRPMFDVQWTEYFTKCRRNLGTILWKHTSPVVVFKDEEFLGGEKEFARYCNTNFKFHIYEKFALVGKESLINFIKSSERPHVFMTISIDGEVIGSILIQLYTDLVPLACDNFLRLVKDCHRGYYRSPVHRVVKSAWIQLGGYRLRHHSIPCENYYVPHDARGIISMCHSGKHHDNNTQFFISLQKSHWMDYYYVAFGQVIHGEEILQKIEAVPTKYEIPQVPIIIEECRQYTCEHKPDKKLIEYFEHWMANDGKSEYENYPDDVSDYRDTPSVFSEGKLVQGLYSYDDKVCPCPEDDYDIEEEEEDDKRLKICTRKFKF